MHGLLKQRTILLALLALAPASVAAQRVTGGGSDGVTLPRGAFRVGVGGESSFQRDRWRDGRLEGLAGSMTGDHLFSGQLGTLTVVNYTMGLLGVPSFAADLGAPRVDARQRLFVAPLSIEYGVADWLTLGVRSSFVRTRADALFRIRGDSGRASMGMNPYYLGTAVPGQNAAITGAYSSATLNLIARRNACQANAGAYPECPTILAELTQVGNLAARNAQFLQGLIYLYGNGTVDGSRYVPFVGSRADTLMRAHADSLRTALERYGVTDVTASTGLPLGAEMPLSAQELDRLVTDSTWGYGARPLNDAAIQQLGDVYVSALIRLHDSFAARGAAARFVERSRGWRQAVLVEGRLGTGRRERPDELLDLGTGTGTNAITVRSITDGVWNEKFWVTVAIGYTKPFAKDIMMRVPQSTGSDAEWFPAWSERLVAVEPGGQVDVELAPRWQLSDYVSLGAQWLWRTKAADRHEWSGVYPVVPLNVNLSLDAAGLDARTEQQEQRFGLNATYSTLAARMRGVPGLAFDVSYIHQQSVASSSGVVPKQWQDRIVFRYYTGFLGR